MLLEEKTGVVGRMCVFGDLTLLAENKLCNIVFNVMAVWLGLGALRPVGGCKVIRRVDPQMYV